MRKIDGIPEGNVWGIVKDKFNAPEGKRYITNFLYYGDGKLTDDHYIQDVHLFTGDGFTNKGEHYIYVLGEAVEGNYISTCKVKGVGLIADTKDLAFAQVIEDKHAYEENGSMRIIGVAKVKFLERG